MRKREKNLYLILHLSMRPGRGPTPYFTREDGDQGRLQ